MAKKNENQAPELTPEELAQAYAEQTAKVAELEGTISKLTAHAEELVKQNAELSAAAGSGKAAKATEFKIGKQTYVVRKPSFKLNGVKHTAKELTVNAELAEQLLAVKGQTIVELKSKK